jgi:hypothetical protein
MLTAHGIRVIPFVTGDVDAVIHAWLTTGLNSGAFLMPGCCRRGRPRPQSGQMGWGQARTGMRRSGRGTGGQGRQGGDNHE